MITVLSHNIISPLGSTTEDNFRSVLRQQTAVRQWHGRFGSVGDFCASLFDDGSGATDGPAGLSRLERLALRSIRAALKGTDVDTASGRTLLVLSTTKGNVEWLADGIHPLERALPDSSARMIAAALGVTTAPIVVDNACVSGLAALTTAWRLLMMGRYDRAIVCGVEVQSKFIISGFQSLKAVSPLPCRPFDIDRMGLNLGEAAATIVLGRGDDKEHGWKIVDGCQRNDAYHLSAPSKTGLGARMALTQAVGDYPPDDIAFISPHGTATLFNDQMESVAIAGAGLGAVPVVGLKGYYGHTMGACGVMETALSMCAVDNGIVPSTMGFAELGVSGRITVAANAAPTSRKGFVKMLSGFGGCNAAMLLSSNKNAADRATADCHEDGPLQAKHNVHITESTVCIDGKVMPTHAVGRQMLTEIYKGVVGDYPRFYKMDLLSRLGFVATELLLRAEGGVRFAERSDRAVVLVGHSGSVLADMNYLSSISDADDYFPSPERFVYTLPNIVTGEIAIRNKYHGETGFYLLADRNEVVVDDILRSAFCDRATNSVVGGWIECGSETAFEADLSIFERKADGGGRPAATK